MPVIDWSRPWLAPYTGIADGSACRGNALDTLNAAGAAPVCFVPHSALPAGEAYEQFVFETRTVPTRDNLHDFFNGLCWLRFPQIKTKLNQLQAREIASSGMQAVRGPVRDALTVFDENAAFLLASPPLWDALLQRDWRRLFVEYRPMWQRAQLVLFGHALLEKLAHPRKPITAHVYLAHPAVDSLSALDAFVAADIEADKLAGKPFVPLPVLGVPGWWPENENFSFYDDSDVFRSRR